MNTAPQYKEGDEITKKEVREVLFDNGDVAGVELTNFQTFEAEKVESAEDDRYRLMETLDIDGIGLD
jgi:hypothetical protein